MHKTSWIMVYLPYQLVRDFFHQPYLQVSNWAGCVSSDEEKLSSLDDRFPDPKWSKAKGCHKVRVDKEPATQLYRALGIIINIIRHEIRIPSRTNQSNRRSDCFFNENRGLSLHQPALQDLRGFPWWNPTRWAGPTRADRYKWSYNSPL